MKLVDIHFKNGSSAKGYVFDVKIALFGFNKVYLPNSRYNLHILRKHPEMKSLELIQEIIADPDYVLRDKYSKKDTFHFRKNSCGVIYCVVVTSKYTGYLPKNKAYIYTAYTVNPALNNRERFAKVIYSKDESKISDIKFAEEIYSDPEMYNFDFN